MKRRNIFVSYRRKDRDGNTSGTDVARTIKQHLEIVGYRGRVFFDYSALTDDEFEFKILNEIERSKVMILVLTHDTMFRCVNEEDWVRREIIHAIKHNVKIIPIEVDNLFNGYPENMCDELKVIMRLHHSKVHMDSSFENDMNTIIEKRIKPVLSIDSPTNYKRLFYIVMSIVAFFIIMIIIGLTSDDESANNEAVAEVDSVEVSEQPISEEHSKIIKHFILDFNKYNDAHPIMFDKEVELIDIHAIGEGRIIELKFKVRNVELDKNFSNEHKITIQTLYTDIYDKKKYDVPSKVMSENKNDFSDHPDTIRNAIATCGYSYSYRYVDKNDEDLAQVSISNADLIIAYLNDKIEDSGKEVDNIATE